MKLNPICVLTGAFAMSALLAPPPAAAADSPKLTVQEGRRIVITVNDKVVADRMEAQNPHYMRGFRTIARK